MLEWPYMTIVLAGGSGFIGGSLAQKLLDQGHTVVIIDRIAPRFTHEHLYFINCDLATSPLPYSILERADAVINLIGAPIDRKWTPEVKEQIRESRVGSTTRIVEGIAQAANRPPVFICASAIGFYGDTGNEIADEQTPVGGGFLAAVVADWEAAARAASEYGVRVVLIRTAPVLGPRSGFFKRLTTTMPFGILTKITKQDFAVSWIHEADIVRAYLFALETGTLQGVVNAAAPEQTTYFSLLRALGAAFRRKVWGTVPAWILKWKLGEAFAALTINQQAAPKRLLDKGFVFEYPTITAALSDIAHDSKR